MTPSTLCATTSFQIESWEKFWNDVKGPILELHWEELALDKDKIKLSFDTTRYEECQRLGMLYVATIREEEKLVGYYVAFLLKHMHYNDAGTMAHTDVYFILPEYRRGGLGVRFFLFIEDDLRKRGVVKIYQSTKIHQNHSSIFAALGYKASDVIFTKMLA